MEALSRQAQVQTDPGILGVFLWVEHCVKLRRHFTSPHIFIEVALKLAERAQGGHAGKRAGPGFLLNVLPWCHADWQWADEMPSWGDDPATKDAVRSDHEVRTALTCTACLLSSTWLQWFRVRCCVPLVWQEGCSLSLQSQKLIQAIMAALHSELLSESCHCQSHSAARPGL